MSLLSKTEGEKYVSSFIDMINHRQSDNILKHITRNNDYWKIVNYIMLDYYSGKKTSEYELIKKLNCSIATANNYIYDLVESKLILKKKINQDMRKVHLTPTHDLVFEMSEYIKRFKEFYAQTKF
jgi:predicted transcriptional regulator